jgi:zinc transport system substrate-binding protein
MLNYKLMKKILFLILVFAIFGGGYYILSNTQQEKSEPAQSDTSKVSVVATLFPQYDFAKVIGGDKVEVTLLLPPGVEAHAYEPKPSDITSINEAEIFVYTGDFMELWAKDIIASIDQKVKVVDASRGIEMLKESEGTHEDEHADEYGGVDPHIWLDFENTKIMAENIAKTLIEVDPKNAGYYQANLQTYQSKLTELDNSYKNTLSNCETKTIVYGGHYAFGYLTRKYGLEYVAAQGFSPDAEPTAKDLIQLVEQIKGDNIRYVFYEELTSPKVAETLANETDAKLLLLNAAHNLSKEDVTNNISFVEIMEKNLVNLKTGLNCSM